MTRTLRAIFCGVALLQGWAFAATTTTAKTSTNPPSVPPAFTSALYATPIGNNAAEAFFLVNLLRRAEGPDDDVQALRTELLHAYVDQILHPPAPATPAPAPGSWASFKRMLPGQKKAPVNDVAAAIERGRQRDSVLDTPFRNDWQAAINRALAPRWETGASRVPLFTLDMREMRPIAPGIWAGPPGPDGQLRLMLSLQLVNTSAAAVPVYRPDIILQGALRFTCDWDRLPKRQSEMEANAVTLLQPGAVSELLTCEAPPVAAYWREQLPALMAAAGQAGLQAVLVPHDLDSTRRLYHVELAFAQAAPQTAPWGERLLLARQEMHRQWAPAEHALDAPESGRFASSPHQGWSAAGSSLAAFLGATVVALGLFAGGRMLLRAGIPKGGVAVATLLAAGGMWGLALSKLGGGTGYSHPLYVGIALWSGYFGPMLLGVLALHGLHKLLDDEQLEWWETVTTGWRRTFNVSAPTSRAEFWGFLAHGAWLWALARICLMPLDRWIGFALLVPLVALITRRMLSMTRQEWIEVVVMVVCTVLLVLA